ncbi:hypothetical protein ACET3Z_016493 [Daucus carota]
MIWIKHGVNAGRELNALDEIWSQIPVIVVDSGIIAPEFLRLEGDEHLNKDLSFVTLNHYHQERMWSSW